MQSEPEDTGGVRVSFSVFQIKQKISKNFKDTSNTKIIGFSQCCIPNASISDARWVLNKIIE